MKKEKNNETKIKYLLIFELKQRYLFTIKLETVMNNIKYHIKIFKNTIYEKVTNIQIN